VQLDFHTNEAIPDIEAKFDPGEFEIGVGASSRDGDLLTVTLRAE
jgi:hypothetical protein